MDSVIFYLQPVLDFIKNLSGAETGLEIFFFILICGFVLFALCCIAQDFRIQRSRHNKLLKILKKESQETVAPHRQDLIERFKKADSVIDKAWRKFNANLITIDHDEECASQQSISQSDDSSAQDVSFTTTQSLYNPMTAEEFFNPKALQIKLGHSRLLATMPALLTGLGVLGTFMGLLMGLTDLSVLQNVDISQSTDISTKNELAGDLTAGIFGMIGGAATAFKTSVWGVVASLAINILEKMAAGCINAKNHKLQDRIDELYPHIDINDFLQEIERHAHQSSIALSSLAEKLSDKMQESIQQMGTTISQAFAQKLEDLLVPALDKMVNATQDQIQVASKSSQNQLEDLLTRFQDSLEKAGQKQGNAINDATDAMTLATNQMAETIQDLSHQVSNTMFKMIGQYSDSIEVMENAVKKQGDANAQEISRIFVNMRDTMTQVNDSISNQLETQQQNNEKYNEQLTNQLDRVLKETQSTIALVQNNAEELSTLSQSFDRLCKSNEQSSTMMSTSAKNLATTSERFGRLSSDINSSIQRMNDSISQNLNKVSEKITANIEQMERSMNAATSAAQSVSDANKNNMDLLKSTSNELKQSIEYLQMVQDSFGACAEKADHSFNNLSGQFNNMMDTINSSTENFSNTLAKQMEEYHSALTTNMDVRMNKWNEQTHEYTSTMTDAIEAISAVVAEIEAQTNKR